MSIMRDRTLLRAVCGRGILAVSLAMLVPATCAASPALKKSLATQEQIDKAAVESQQRIDKVVDQTAGLLEEYRYVLRQTDSLRSYNGYLEKIVRGQEAELASLDEQIVEVEVTNREIVPLMLRMVTTLEQFVDLDVPFLLEERRARVAGLAEMMDRADVTLAEKYRRVMEAYQIETEYGRTLEAYRGTLDAAGRKRSVDFLRVGRVALLYQTLDGKESGVWNRATKQWETLSNEYRTAVRKGLRIAKRQAAPDLLRLPVAAAEPAQ